MGRFPLLLGVAAALAIPAFMVTSSATTNACALDQKPSVFADGLLAKVNPATPTTSAQLASWAYFVFPRAFGTRRAVTLTENRREVAQTLVASAMRRPWRWHFGDGQVAYGWTVRHAYAHPGSYKIVVDAFLPGTKKWYYFDQVVITIRH